MFTRKKRITFNEFVDRIEDIALVEKYTKRKKSILETEFEDLTFLPYQTLKHEIPDLIKQEKFEVAIFEIVRQRKKDLTLKEVEDYDHYEKLMFYFWIKSQYEAIAELETAYLSSPPDAKLAQAGIKELDVLGDISLIDSLAQGDVLRWEAVRQLPYATVFDKQLKMVIEGRINKRLAELNKQK